MKILVTVKRTPHREVKMKAGADGELAAGGELKYEINPFDELAVEEALRIQESTGSGGQDVETVVVTIGGEESKQQLLSALAMGLGRAMRVNVDRELDALQTARCLAAVVAREKPDLVLMGKLAVDDENGQIPSMLAALLGWPQANQASKVELAGGRKLRVTCEVDAGMDEVEVELPALVTTDLRLNEPRYASLPGIMKAKKKPLDVHEADEFGELGEGRAQVVAYRSLPPKGKGILVPSVGELVEALEERRLL